MVCGFYPICSWMYKIYENQIFWRHISEILSIHEPSLELSELTNFNEWIRLQEQIEFKFIKNLNFGRYNYIVKIYQNMKPKSVLEYRICTLRNRKL